MTKSFRTRLAEPKLLLGSFVKTASPAVVEIGAIAGLDFIVLDTEHAPFSNADIDRGVLAGRAAGVAVIVRVPQADGPWIQQAIDMGADGILVPHVDGSGRASAVVAAARFRNGTRGFSTSPRAGRYGATSMPDYLANEDHRVSIIVQIEDAAAVTAIDTIVAVEGIDAVFVGPADLAVSLGGTGPTDEMVVEATRKISQAARRGGVPWGTFQASYAQVKDEPRFLVVGSDQAVLRSGWQRLIAEATKE